MVSHSQYGFDRFDFELYRAQRIKGISMSLTSFVAQADVAARLKPLRPSPPRSFPNQLLVPAKSKRYGLIGTAFDYLFRFEIKRRAPHAIDRSWAATSSLFWLTMTVKQEDGSYRSRISDEELSRVADVVAGEVGIDDDPNAFLFLGKEKHGKVVSETGIPIGRKPGEVYHESVEIAFRVARRMLKMIEAGRIEYGNYIRGDLERAIIAATAVQLAKMDAVLRSGSIYPAMFDRPQSEDVDEILALLEIVPFDQLLSDTMILNPTFSDSIMVARPTTLNLRSMPSDVFSGLRASHSESSPVFVVQGELDELIDLEGGVACPLAAALITVQGLRSMANMPLDQNPHRTALRMFRDMPELKRGRITNDRFVELLKLLCECLQERPIAIRALSAPNSAYAVAGERWSDDLGPDLSTNSGEIKVLAYTVSDSGGIVLGRHFVLLQNCAGNQISFLNPGKPEKEYTFIVEFRGDVPHAKRQVFLHSPAGMDKSNQTYELNTIFTIRLIAEHPEASIRRNSSVTKINAKIDELAIRLRKSGDLTNPIAWRKSGADFGLPGLDLSAKAGGSEWSTVDMLEVFRHAGRLNLNLRDVIGAAHGRPLVNIESAYANEVLHQIVEGKAYVAVAITEPEIGSDTKAMQSQAVKKDDGFALSGRKLWNARLRQATHVVLYTQSANGNPGSLTAFLLPINHPGLEIVDEFAHGLTGNSFGGLVFNDMRVGPELVIGKDGDGGTIFEEHFVYWRLMQSAAAIGCGEAALEQMAKRIQERHAYGGPIGRFTHLQQPLGEYTTKLKMAMALAREAAALIDRGDYKAASPLVNGVKAEGVEIALAAADTAMRAHGALGYSREVDLGDRVRDLMGLRIADGTTDVMRMSVVRDTFGSNLWKMAVRSFRADDEQPTTSDVQQPESELETK
jgi:alkylation response protein AidB-like acyl-CoA dehydrogenase